MATPTLPQPIEALNAEGVCNQNDRFNCKYCRRSGRDCGGATGTVHRGQLVSATLNGEPFRPTLSYEQQLGRAKRPAPRQLLEESYTEAEGFYSIPVDGQKPDYICREWVFRYSDGDVETVTTRRPAV